MLHRKLFLLLSYKTIMSIKGPQLHLSRHKEIRNLGKVKIRNVNSSIQWQNWVNLYTCMCFITGTLHFFHHDPSISLHIIKQVQISKRIPLFCNSLNKFTLHFRLYKSVIPLLLTKKNVNAILPFKEHTAKYQAGKEHDTGL